MVQITKRKRRPSSLVRIMNYLLLCILSTEEWTRRRSVVISVYCSKGSTWMNLSSRKSCTIRSIGVGQLVHRCWLPLKCILYSTAIDRIYYRYRRWVGRFLNNLKRIHINYLYNCTQKITFILV